MNLNATLSFIIIVISKPVNEQNPNSNGNHLSSFFSVKFKYD